MKIIIDDALLNETSLALEELLYLMLLDLGVSSDMVSVLEEKGWLHNKHLTEESKQKLADVLNKTKEEPSSKLRISTLAENLRNIFPKGKKDGTPYYWRGNSKEIEEKLKKFFVYFSDKYSDSQILSAARNYVKSFNGDYTYMRLLKYFIWKNDRFKTSENTSVEQVSDLASYIENYSENEENNDRDWTSELI